MTIMKQINVSITMTDNLDDDNFDDEYEDTEPPKSSSKSSKPKDYTQRKQAQELIKKTEFANSLLTLVVFSGIIFIPLAYFISWYILFWYVLALVTTSLFFTKKKEILAKSCPHAHEQYEAGFHKKELKKPIRTKKSIQLEKIVDKFYAKLKLFTTIVAVGVLPISFLYKYFNVTTATIVYLLIFCIIAIFNNLYKNYIQNSYYN